MNETIEVAIEQFRNQAGRYRRSSRYYAGEHSLSFATEKFANTFGDLFREFALNLCPAVCDAIKDKLKITGFGVRSEERDRSRTLSADVNEIWRANRMAIRAGEVHKEALKNGDAYVIVWPAADGTVQIFPNSAETCTVGYDEEMPGRVKWAAKYWRTRDKRTRLNLFFPDRIEKFISKDAQDGFLPNAESFTPTVESARSIASKNAEERDESRTLNNPFGVVPVFHFANNADIGSFGVSELEPAIPVQDGLNKAVLDMLVAMEVCAYRQRWAAGIEIQYDKDGNAAAPFKAGIDHLWLAEDPDAKFGDFAAADLEQFLKVKDGFRIDIASVTGTPLYYLMPQVRGFPSGESLRKAETRFVAKLRDRQEQFGTVWEDVMTFALRIAGHANAAVTTEWEPASPLTEREMLENLKLRRELGLDAEEGLNKI
ncbi:MAG: phage portal protein [Pyrinomonadaceae bacterium]|nr:phage portal protein [Pyrinomonadaceae bacterium]